MKISMIDMAPGTEVVVTLKRDRLIGGDETDTVRFELAGESPAHPM